MALVLARATAPEFISPRARNLSRLPKYDALCHTPSSSTAAYAPRCVKNMATSVVEYPLAHSPLRDTKDEASPYALTNFLPAGTLILDVPPGTLSCSMSHVEGWHQWPLGSAITRDAPGSDAPFLRVVEFLVFHEFIATTSRIGDDGKLYLRVYLIPFDLRGVEGRLRRRDETTILAPARKWMRVLFYQLDRGRTCWNGGSDEGAPHHAQFFVDNQVSLYILPMSNCLDYMTY